MAFKQNPLKYVRRLAPIRAESLPKHNEEELKRLEEACLSYFNGLVETEGRITTQEARKAAAQPDSTATTVAGIVSDFNALLAKLRAAGLMS